MRSLGHPWLEGLETPYLWRPSESLGVQERASLLDRLQHQERESRDDRYLSFNSFVINLLLGYELFATGLDEAAATSRLGELEMGLFKMDIVSNCSFYLRTRRAQWHTMLASRAALLASRGRLAESRQAVEENFDPVSVFNSVEKSAILGIKSRAYLEYGPSAWPQALTWAEEAIAMNPGEAEWHFTAGKALEIIRLSDGGSRGTLKEEIRHFITAVTQGGKGYYKVHLAHVYYQLTRNIEVENVQNKTIDLIITNLNNRSYELLQSALDNAGNDTETLLGSVRELLRKPHRERARQPLTRAMELLLSAPKQITMFYNVAGKYYLKLVQDKAKALEYFEEGSKLGDYSCSVHELRLRLELSREADAERALRHLVARFSDDTAHRESAVSHLGAWLLLGKRDLLAALAIFGTILEHNPNCTRLSVYKPIFERSSSPLDLLHILSNEVRSAPAGSLPSQQKDFIKFLAMYRPVVRPVNWKLLDEISELSKDV